MITEQNKPTEDKKFFYGTKDTYKSPSMSDMDKQNHIKLASQAATSLNATQFQVTTQIKQVRDKLRRYWIFSSAILIFVIFLVVLSTILFPTQFPFWLGCIIMLLSIATAVIIYSQAEKWADTYMEKLNTYYESMKQKANTQNTTSPSAPCSRF